MKIRELLKDLQRGYIPGGKRVRGPFEWKRLPDSAFCLAGLGFVPRCGTQTGDDIQSGPIYCGRIADFEGNDEEGNVVHSCEIHLPWKDRERFRKEENDGA